MVCFNERCRRKEERSKQDQTNNNAKQHSTPKAVTFPKKNELPQVGLEPTTLCTGLGLISTYIPNTYIVTPVFLFQVLSATTLYLLLCVAYMYITCSYCPIHSLTGILVQVHSTSTDKDLVLQ